MAKVGIAWLVSHLMALGVSKEDIPILVMTAFYESNFERDAEHPVTEAMGLFQINASSFYKEKKPDNTLRSFFKETGETLTEEEFNERLKDEKYNTKFAVHYLNVIKEDLAKDGSSQFGMVRDNDNDPFAPWVGYLQFVKPWLESPEKLKGRGKNDEQKQEDVLAGIKAYTDAHLMAHQKEEDSDLKRDIEGMKTGPIDNPHQVPEEEVEQPEVEQPIKLKSSVFLRNLDKVTRFNEPDYIKENYGVETPVQQVQKYSSSIEKAYQEYLDAINK
jgi:hypothetical protein